MKHKCITCKYEHFDTKDNGDLIINSGLCVFKNKHISIDEESCENYIQSETYKQARRLNIYNDKISKKLGLNYRKCIDK